ncbi:hypothetical protein EDD21DRAFT_392866 [Dissophora ornata]|nr:hypothetical protein BGZ58_002343 [Dissophora ornata]KAI8594805.1 hypothetical protein EDD21DRAFT_392866 [Dissophora ornata]
MAEREGKELGELDQHRLKLKNDLKKQIDHLKESIEDINLALLHLFNYPEPENKTTMTEKRGLAITPDTASAAMKVDDCVIKWDPADPVHVVLRANFGMEHIPIIKGTKDIDITRIKHFELKNQPELNLDIPGGLNELEAIVEVARRVIRFKGDIERALKLHLTEVLFDMLAWTYLPASLVKIGLAEDFENLIGKYPVKERTWSCAIKCLNKAMKLDLISCNVADIVMKMRPMPGESIRAFSDRLVPLMEVAGIDDKDCYWMVKALGNYISDIGLQATINKYGSLSKVESLKEYLQFLMDTAGAINGPRTDHIDRLLLKYKIESKTDGSGQDESKKRDRDEDHYSSALKNGKDNCHYRESCRAAKVPRHYKDRFHRYPKLKSSKSRGSKSQSREW